MSWKIWARRRGVQLIVFFAAIREILKKEIYGEDKQRFSAMKTKGKLMASGSSSAGLRIQQIRFVNRRRFLKLPFLALPRERIRNRGTGSLIRRKACDGCAAGIPSSLRMPPRARTHSRISAATVLESRSKVFDRSSPSSPRPLTSRLIAYLVRGTGNCLCLS